MDANNKPIFRSGLTVESKSTFDRWFHSESRDVLPHVLFFHNRSQSAEEVATDSDRFIGTFESREWLPANQTSLFTAELTTNFLYTASSTTPSPSLVFTSQYEIWVFINQSLVVSIGGYHLTGPDSQTIDLHTLDLVDGEVYSMHVFIACRVNNVLVGGQKKPLARRVMLQSLSPVFCNALSVSVRAGGVYPFTTLNTRIAGAAAIQDEALDAFPPWFYNHVILTSVSSRSLSSASWNNRLHYIRRGFVSTFKFRFTEASSEPSTRLLSGGLAFVLQNSKMGLNARGGSGDNLGYDIDNSVAIEFRCDRQGDVESQTIELHSGYELANDPTDSTKLKTTFSLSLPAASNVDMCRLDTTTDVKIVYYPGTRRSAPQFLSRLSSFSLFDEDTDDGKNEENTGRIDVYVGNLLALSAEVDDGRLDAISSQGQMFIGFTSATSDVYSSTLHLYDWVIRTTPLAGGLSTISLNDGDPNIDVTSDSGDPIFSAALAAPSLPQYRVESRDACGHAVQFGGSMINVLAFGGKNIGSQTETTQAEIEKENEKIELGFSYIDRQSGFYDLWVWNSQAGGLSLQVYVNEQVSYNRTMSAVIVPSAASHLASTFTQDSQNPRPTAGSTIVLTVHLSDAFGNLVSASQGVLERMLVRFASADVSPPSLLVNVTHAVQYRARIQTAGISTLFITLDNNDIVGSPISITTLPGSVDPGACTLTGQGLARSTAGDIANIGIVPFDAYSNRILAFSSLGVSLDDVQLSLSRGNNEDNDAQVTTLPPVWDVDLSQIRLRYMINTSGTYDMNILIGGTSVSGAALFSPYISPGAVALRQSTVSFIGDGNSVDNNIDEDTGNPASRRAIVAGTPASMVIQAVDRFGNERKIPNPSSDLFFLQLVRMNNNTSVYQQALNSTGTFVMCDNSDTTASLQKEDRTRVLSCAYQSSGRYLVSFKMLHAGTYQAIFITELPQSLTLSSEYKSGDAFVIVPARPNSSQSSYTVFPSSISAGEEATVSVVVRDEYGNRREKSDDSFRLQAIIVPGASTDTQKNQTSSISPGSTGATPSSSPSTLYGEAKVLSDISILFSQDASASDPKQALYRQTFILTAAETFQVYVEIDGEQMPVSADSKIRVSAGSLNKDNCILAGEGLIGGISEANVSVSVRLKDDFRNDIKDGELTIRLTLTLNPTSTLNSQLIQTYDMRPVEDSEWIYTVEYPVPIYESNKNNYLLRVEWYSYSPFPTIVAIYDNFASSRFSLDNAYATAEDFSDSDDVDTDTGNGAESASYGLSVTRAGYKTTFKIVNRDERGTAIVDDNTNVNIIFKVFLQHKERPSVQLNIVDIIYDSVRDFYIVTYTPIVSGSYSIRIYQGAIETQQTKLGQLPSLLVLPGKIFFFSLYVHIHTIHTHICIDNRSELRRTLITRSN